MFGASYKIAKVWGIPIRIHISLVILLAFFAVASGLGGVLWVLGVQVGIFTSIALHELGHSFVAIRKGCRVREITLLFLGGVAQMEEIPEKPMDELQMAIAGPLVSIVLGAALWIGGPYLPLAFQQLPVSSTGQYIEVNAVQFVGLANLTLAAFNLLPGFPMDGGRVLRALLVRRKGRVQATRIAARCGKITALVFGYLGLTSLPSGLFLLFMAFFLYSNAAREYRMVVAQERMRRERAEGAAFGFGQRTPPDGAGDRVTVSPPPYEKGPGTETEIHPEKKDPFQGLFGR